MSRASRGLALAAAVIVAGPRLRQRYLDWGSTALERTMAVPGDALLARADVCATRAIAIAASPEAVWPWIAQIGQGRGGFYSYDRLENLVGCRMRSADRVVPAWQSISPGDEVRLHPEVALQVAEVAPGRALVLRGGVPMGSAEPPYDFTWAFVLCEQPDGSTRLVVRERYAYTRWWSAVLVEPVELVSFVMSARMLRGIRERASASSRTTP